jgi:hypothetical protein
LFLDVGPVGSSKFSFGSAARLFRGASDFKYTKFAGAGSNEKWSVEIFAARGGLFAEGSLKIVGAVH